LERFLTLSK